MVKRKHRPGLPGLAAIRRRAGLSQSELAAKLHIDETAVSHWENGKSTPAGGRLVLVADVLGCTIDELFREAS